MRNGKYELIVPPPEYPGRRYRGRYAYEHHVVWWQKTGELLKPGHVIHHRNDKKRENVPGNLEEKTRSAHTADHKRTGITCNKLTCRWCGMEFERERRNCKYDGKPTYCCRSHQVSAQQKEIRERKLFGVITMGRETYC